MAGPIRVTAYNILDGGIGRADPLAEVLLAQEADVICLVEADDDAVRERLAWRLGYEMAYATGRDGRTSCVLTRGHILATLNVAAFDAAAPRSLLLADLEVGGMALSVAVAHFTGGAADARETRREREAASLLAHTSAWRDDGRPHLLAGDFNSTSPDYEVHPDRLPAKVRPHFRDNGGVLPRRVVARLFDAGYVDAHAGVADGSFTTLEPGLRVDYLMYRHLTACDARVETDRLARAAGDHFPVTASFKPA